MISREQVLADFEVAVVKETGLPPSGIDRDMIGWRYDDLSYLLKAFGVDQVHFQHVPLVTGRESGYPAYWSFYFYGNRQPS